MPSLFASSIDDLKPSLPFVSIPTEPIRTLPTSIAEASIVLLPKTVTITCPPPWPWILTLFGLTERLVEIRATLNVVNLIALVARSLKFIPIRRLWK